MEQNEKDRADEVQVYVLLVHGERDLMVAFWRVGSSWDVLRLD